MLEDDAVVLEKDAFVLEKDAVISKKDAVISCSRNAKTDSKIYRLKNPKESLQP